MVLDCIFGIKGAILVAIQFLESHLKFFLIFLQVCHISGAEVIKKVKTDAQVTIVENCGHVLALERPGRCCRLIRNFVSMHSSITSSDSETY